MLPKIEALFREIDTAETRQACRSLWKWLSDVSFSESAPQPMLRRHWLQPKEIVFHYIWENGAQQDHETSLLEFLDSALSFDARCENGLHPVDAVKWEARFSPNADQFTQAEIEAFQTDLSTGFAKRIGRHFVSLTWYDTVTESGEWRFVCTSGVVFSARGHWHLLTAGHILRDIEAILAGGYEMRGCAIADSFGADAKNFDAVPFDIQSAGKVFLVDETLGVDFGLIRLSDMYVQLMEANGVVPLSEKNWVRQNTVEFEKFQLVGLPSIHSSMDCVESEESIVLRGSGKGYGIPVEAIEDPRGVDTEFPRFVGRLLSDALPDIDGMSGGPIFGFGRVGDGRLRYWVVAIQSAWLPSSRIIFGCPLPVIGILVDEAYEQAEANS